MTIVSINRPHCRNAVDGATARKLYDAFLAFDADDAASVAVFTGTGGYFCAGADLKAVAAGDPNKKREIGGHDSIAPMGPSRLRLSKPVIAAVEGFAVAGGMELALWADMRVVAEDATFGIFCRRFGVPLIDLGTIRLPRLIGHSQAIDLILTGRPVGGAEALRMGLANRLVPKGEARAHAIALAKEIAALPANLPARRPAVGAAAMGPRRGRGHRQRNARRAEGDRVRRNAVGRDAICLRHRPPRHVRRRSRERLTISSGRLAKCRFRRPRRHEFCCFRMPQSSTTGMGSGGKRSVASRLFHLRPGIRPALNDIIGGSAASVLTVTFGLSYALLIFTGPLTPYLSYGVAATFIASAVLGAVVALGSSFPFAVAAPESSTAAMTGISGVVAGRAHDGARSIGVAAGAGSHDAWSFSHCHRHRALRLRGDADGPRDPLRALSRRGRVPRCHRLSDRFGCDPRHHRPSPAIRRRSISSPMS